MSNPNLVIELRHTNDPALTQSILDLKELIVTTNAEFAAQLNDLKTQVVSVGTQLSKAKDEVVAKVAALEAQINSSGDVPPEVVSAFADLQGAVAGLQSTSQALDDIVPDAPTP